MTRRGGTLLVVVWGAALAGAAVALVRVGHGPLSAPPARHGLRALDAWIRGRDAPTMAMSVLRLLALALDAYLLATTALGTAARLTRRAAAIDLADRITPRSVRALLATAIGGLVLATPIGMSVATAATPTPLHDAPPPLARIADDGPLLRRVGSARAPLAPATTRGAPASGPTPTRIVAPGDNLWEIAAREVGADPSDATSVAPYWRALIAANRDRLRDPDDPSLIYPGQWLVIPPR